MDILATSQLLKGIEEAFISVRESPPPNKFSYEKILFQDLVENKMSSRLSLDELNLLVAYAERREIALKAARNGQLTLAQSGFEEVQRLLEQESMTLEAKLLIEVYLEPAEAYLHYKFERYDRAQELILHSASLDKLLINDFGYDVLSGHLLQLGHNLLRMHVRRRDSRSAVNLAGAFLDYLEFRTDSGLLSDIVCVGASLDAVPDSVLKLYFEKMCGEVALLLAGKNDDETLDLFKPLANHSSPIHSETSDFGVLAHLWLFCKLLALQGQIEEFLITATSLIRKGRSNEHFLWFATIQEVIGVCQSLGIEGVRLSNWIADEAMRLPDAPWAFKQMDRKGQPT